MITTKFYQDKRFTKGDEGQLAPIKLTISRKGTTALINTDVKVLPNQWDKVKQQVINHDNAKRINLHLSKFKIKVETILMDMEENGVVAGMTAAKVKEYITNLLSPSDSFNNDNLFINRYIEFAESRKAVRTKEIYLITLKRIKEFDKGCESLSFEDIDKKWLSSFNKFLSKSSPSNNARNIHFRNIRAVFNEAIDDEITTFYPFRKFKLSYDETKKRSLTIEQLRELFNLQTFGAYVEYLDMFKLIFLLCGINLVDLFNLTPKNIVNGRVEYVRAKTHKRYSIRIEPEAMEIIERYKGSKKLLRMAERYNSSNNYKSTINRNLKKIGQLTGENYKQSNIPIMKPIEEELSTYWARHTWATIAAELDIPKETIAAGLGHSIGSPITSIYIDFNLKKVDEANRRIIDYVLYNKV